MNTGPYLKYPLDLTSTAGPGEKKPPVSWMHTIPSYMPWSVPQVYSLDSEVMKFTAESSFLLNSSLMSGQTDVKQPITDMNCHPRLQHKRKGNDLEVLPFANKVYIGEEGMVARMNELYIGNNNNNCSVSSSDGAFVTNANIVPNEQTSIDDLSDIALEDHSSQLPVLVLAPELRKLQKTDAVLPSSILKSLKQPCMEIVLWKPPCGVIDEIIQNATRDKCSEDTEPIKSKECSDTLRMMQRISQPAAEQMFITKSNVLVNDDEGMDVT